MIDTLLKHYLQVDLVELLPVRSLYSSYGEVELNQRFLSIRDIILSIAVTHGIEDIASNAIDLINIILNGEPCVSSNGIDRDQRQSVLTVMRLLNDAFARHWDSIEENLETTERQNTYLKQRHLYTNCLPGFSNSRHDFRISRPKPISSKLVIKILDLCSKLKSHTTTINLMKNATDELYGKYQHLRFTLIQDFQVRLEDVLVKEDAVLLDMTVEYCQRFVGSANPQDFLNYLNNTIVGPLVIDRSLSDTHVIKSFDLFGCIYITSQNLLHYLEIVKRLSITLRRSIFNAVLLHHTTKALVLWIISRPFDYVLFTTTELKKNEARQESSNSNSSPNSKSNSTHNNTHHNNSHSNNAKKQKPEQLPKEYDSPIEFLFDQIYSDFNVSSLLGSSGKGSSSASHNQPSSSGQYPGGSKKKKLGQSASTKSLTTIASAPSDMEPNITFVDSYKPTPQRPGLERRGTDTNTILSDNSSENTFENHKFFFSDVAQPPLIQPRIITLQSISDIYTSAEETELGTNASILRFLSLIVMLDREILTEINSVSFKYIFNADGSRPELGRKSSFSSKDGSKEEEESEYSASRSSGIWNFKNGLKKLKSMTPHRKKTVKFLSILLKNLNGSSIASDIAILDTVRAILTLYTVSASVSLVDSEAPTVILSKRLFGILGENLKVGYDWKGRRNAILSNCLSRNKTSFARFQIKFFAASLQLEPHKFLARLNLEEVSKNFDLKLLGLYTEGFRIFFYLICPNEIWTIVTRATGGFFKNLLSSCGEKLQEVSLYPQESLEENINCIINGTLDERLSLGAFFPMSLSSYSPPSATVLQQIDDEINEKYHCDLEASWIPVNDISSLAASLSDTQLADSNITLDQSNQDIRLQKLESNNSTEDSVTTPLSLTRMDSMSFTTSNSSLGFSNTKLTKTHASSSSKGTKSPLTSSVKMGKSSSFSNVKMSKSISISNVKMSKSPSKLLVGKKIPEESKLKTTTGDSLTPETSPSSNTTDYNEVRKILVRLFKIYSRTTIYFYHDRTVPVDLEWLKLRFESISKSTLVGILDSDEFVSRTSESFLNILVKFSLTFTDETSEDSVKGGYLICIFMMGLFNMTLLDMNLSHLKREKLLSCILKFVGARRKLIEIAQKNGFINVLRDAEGTLSSTLTQVSGRALYVSLYCSKPSVQKLLVDEYARVEDYMSCYGNILGDKFISGVENLEFIKAFSVESKIGSGALAAQRRIITNIHKYVTSPDPLIFDSLALMFERWLHLSNKRKCLSQEEFTDFRNIAGIIAVTSGVTLTTHNADKYEYVVLHRENLIRKLDFFVAKQCQWINDPDLLTRENSRDILSNELHPLVFYLLFRNLRKRLGEIVSLDLSLEENEHYFILLEQSILIIRVVLERNDNVHSTMVLFSTDLIFIVDLLTSVISNIPKSSLNYFKSVIYMSRLFQAVQTNERKLAIEGHYNLKNRWLKLVTQWFNHSLNQECDLDNLIKPLREMNLLKRDIDMLSLETCLETSKALKYLTYCVPLEVPPSLSEEEVKKAKTVEFGKYFSILLKGLETFSYLEKYPPFLRPRLKSLNEYLIISLTNLSKINQDASFKYSLPLGYSPNKEIRIAFLEVFTNIVKNVPFKVKEDECTKIETSESVINFCKANPALISKIGRACPAYEADEFASGFMTLFENSSGVTTMVNEMLRDDIRKTSRPTNILRRNNCVTSALSIYTRKVGHEYLVKTLSTVFMELIELDEHFDIERIGDNEVEIERNIRLFKKYMDKVITSIEKSITYFPPDFFSICQNIHTTTLEKFPEHAIIAVGSFFFLRFLCPAVVSPESENIIPIVELKFRKSLIALAKVIQSLANGIDNRIKWQLLERETEFLKNCSIRIFAFLIEISKLDRPLVKECKEKFDETPGDISLFHRYLYFNELEIRKQLLGEYGIQKDREYITDVITFFDNILKNMGQPKIELRHEIPEFIKENMDLYPRLYEFMSKHISKHASGCSIGDFPFLHVSISSDGFPTLSMMLRKIVTFDSNFDDIIFGVIQVYSRIWTTKHYFILDCTEYDKEQEEGILKLVATFSSLLPAKIKENCIKFYYLNPSRNFVNRWIKILKQIDSNINSVKTRLFVNSSEHRDIIKSLNLSNEAIELVSDTRISLKDLELYNERTAKFVPATMKIGTHYLQILNEIPDKIKFIGKTGYNGIKYNSIYRISDILSIDVSIASDSEFIINLSNEEVILKSSKFLEIIKILRQSIQRLEFDYSLENEDISLAENDEDSTKLDTKQRLTAISHILLMVLLGLLSNDDIVKRESYNLLVATQGSYKLNFGLYLHSAPEIFVPDESVPFIQQIFRSIAKCSPELTGPICKLILDALTNLTFQEELVPDILACLSQWIPGLYNFVFLSDEEEGINSFCCIVRTLIRLTVRDEHYSATYIQNIWVVLTVETSFTKFIVNEVIEHALERQYENKDWESVLPLINVLPIVDTAATIISRLMNEINSFSRSLDYEGAVDSWSELLILLNISVRLFFHNTLIAQKFLPEVLFIAALLIDIGPMKVRTEVHKLLMNVCHSLTVNHLLADTKKKNLEQICSIFSLQKLKFIYGFSQDRGRVLQKLSAISFSSNFCTLEYFIDNIMLVIDNADSSGTEYWKANFRKYIMDYIFKTNSFLSARAVMILGIIDKYTTTEAICRHLLRQTIDIVADPIVSDEQIFMVISHIFSYSKIVEGLDPSLPIMKELFWLSTTFLTSEHLTIFEGALLFLINVLKRIYMTKFESESNNRLVVTSLFEVRSFSEPMISELEKLYDTHWTEKNFTHTVISFLCKGLSISSIKTTSLYCIEQLFRNTYYEHTLNPESTDYLSYLLALFLILPPKGFIEILNAIEFEGLMFSFDEDNKIPEVLLNWLYSDSECSRVSLYQSAVMYSSTVFDEPSKFRFLLIMRQLLLMKPICVFRFYDITITEIRRQSTLEHTSLGAELAFSIVELVVQHREYNSLSKYNTESLEFLHKNGLSLLVNIISKKTDNSVTNGSLKDVANLTFKRKFLTTKILYKMAYDNSRI
ncbi:hypothetical protein Kpol_1036p15 [Vanderwaltozyma polyspora DSM 70294]|uniref:Ras-GAP domain-containing protein n=1 Tax=Vanderwaltozyma polyspora (strain ATCC 22028 / DSM 70294 / BCRC 21397 / CBS 2163 / NBRC 10782 / NRRL Y-8283 / UCD 57-17) TaxID=436907 RepID=A7TEG6_VANPO|nr:uncharacterized protein Kpol_1036p15 [Vanderwaltozyma polyspora DSM 70294]EDO19273.1 hypothetical protein Kpol_1036p15 [Vanderwaltozyma polyspora DSM 70294]